MITPVTRGVRVASYLAAENDLRCLPTGLIFALDTAIQGLVERLGRNDPQTVTLTAVYHNLNRYWAEA